MLGSKSTKIHRLLLELELLAYLLATVPFLLNCLIHLVLILSALTDLNYSVKHFITLLRNMLYK